MSEKNQSIEVVKHDLELDEDLRLHKKSWVIQRVGWVLLLVFVVAAALGLFGDGVLGKQKSKSGNATAEYDRFARYESETKILLESPDESINTLSLSQTYVEGMRIVRILPEPEINSGDGDDILYRFNGDHRLVTVYVRPESPGSIRGKLAVNGNSPVNIFHFVYP